VNNTAIKGKKYTILFYLMTNNSRMNLSKTSSKKIIEKVVCIEVKVRVGEIVENKL
jgi:hypothetical protein